MSSRATLFRYAGLEVHDAALVGHYELDDEHFSETVTFEDTGSLQAPGPRAVGALWYLVAGLSYYKSGAARHIDLGETPVSPAGRALLSAALLDGLGEYAFRNDLPLDDVTINGGRDAKSIDLHRDRTRVLTPFGGGIDSVVTVESLPSSLEQALFVVSPPSGPFVPLEDTAALTEKRVLRATRSLDEAILRREGRLNGHVPVTAMITLLAVVAALADDRGAVVMSNEHSASVPNLTWRSREINHQWSKSWVAEQLIGDAVAAAVGSEFVVASFLRDRSELWVAQQFAALSKYHRTFRSCNRAFTQQREHRAASWCGECDKCLFISLVLAPFVSRNELHSALGVEPLADERRFEQLRTLVGLAEQRKPFECVGDPSECAVALSELRHRAEWRDVANITALGPLLSNDLSLNDLLERQGVSRVPPEWLR